MILEIRIEPLGAGRHHESHGNIEALRACKIAGKQRPERLLVAGRQEIHSRGFSEIAVHCRRTMPIVRPGIARHQIIRPRWHDPAHASARIRNIAQVTRNYVHVKM
jgi:hypothetical protein